MTDRYFGEYRGTVTDTGDPLASGRIRARVPDVTGTGDTGWALPCAPFAGSGMGFFALPPTGAAVWIEFEQGDPDFPVWTGGWWATPTETPTQVLVPPQSGKVLLRTDGGSSILIDDTPGTGGITLSTASGQKIALTAISIEIDNGAGAKITLSGPQVSINNGALEVT